MKNLWSANSPQLLWQCDPPISDDVWEQAVRQNLPTLNLKSPPENIDALLEQVLGEGQFGADHWTLSPMRRFYYVIKPLLPRALTRALRQLLQKRHTQKFELSWHIEDRYARFQFETLESLLKLTGREYIQVRALWPHEKRYAFVLTHDIETDKGQKFVRRVADLEESLGFRSSFNFVIADYQVDMGLAAELRQRGFETGVHGLKHDGKLFRSKNEFLRHAEKINKYLFEFGAVGFRAPLTHRNPEWMQALNIEYDLSFFDTDPFEPIPGGTMSILPFFIGGFVELPYTLVQDYTLINILQEKSPRLWLEKVDFIRQYRGMALLNSHPDYLQDPAAWNIYAEFLQAMKQRGEFWHTLPREVARWWRRRAFGKPADLKDATWEQVASLRSAT